jgi:uncharacterized protein DUF6801
MRHDETGRAGLGEELITMRMRTAGWWPHSGRARLDGSSARGGLRFAVLAVVMVAAGMTAGSAGAVGQQAASLQLVYSCAFASGPHAVSAQVTGTFPAAATAGKPVRPTGVGIAITLPHGAVASLARSHAATVTLTATLSTSLTEGSRSTSATWRHFVSAPTAIPRTGSLRLTTTGPAPSVTVTGGKATVAVGDLSLLFATHTANSGRASPPTTPVECVPRAGQDTTLGSIATTGSAPTRAHASPTRAHASPQDDPAKCLPFPKNPKPNPLFPFPKPLKGSREFHESEPSCAYAAGFTNARKLHEAALVGPGLADLLLGQTVFSKFTGNNAYVQVRESGQFEYHGHPVLPPARATLLGFGFMPVSATLQISEIGTVNAVFVTCTYSSCPNPKNFAEFYARVSLNISDVKVNGVPLDVGSHCQTSPFNLELEGLPPAYNVGSQFGVLTGTVTVPSFHGCANGTDNLDPIFTASVSGPGNFAKVTQAPFCTPVNGGGCPPAKPKPVH